MRFWEQLRRVLLRIVGLTGSEYPGVGRDVALAIPMSFAALILIVFPSEGHPSERLKYAAAISLVVLVAVLLLAKRRLLLFGVVAAFVGFRGLVAAAFGLWQGLILAGVATVVVIFCIRNSPIDGDGPADSKSEES